MIRIDMNIAAVRLWQFFPDDTIWINGIAEIIGYSPSENIHIVINDGQCSDPNNKWLVHIYKVNDYHMEYFINYRPKYLSEEFETLFEGWVDFESDIKRII